MNKSEYLKMSRLENRHFWFLGKRFFISTLLADHEAKIKRILDVGAGTGGLSKYLSKYGKVSAIESSSYAILLARKRGIKILSGNAEKLPFKNDAFDLVTLLDVLYHRNVKNDSRAIAEAGRVLRKEGFLLISDSAYEFLKGPHDNALFGKRRYTLNQMEMKLRKGGFRIIRSSYVYFFIFPLVLFKRMILSKLFMTKDSDVKNPGLFLNAALIRLLSLEAWLLRKISFPFGSSIITLAQKK